jgi:hypothetical protein
MFQRIIQERFWKSRGALEQNLGVTYQVQLGLRVKAGDGTGFSAHAIKLQGIVRLGWFAE